MVQGWNWQIARTWFPVNVIFVCMIWTSFPALQLLGVAMVTVLKNLTNLFTITGDIAFFGKRYSLGKNKCLAPAVSRGILCTCVLLTSHGCFHWGLNTAKA